MKELVHLRTKAADCAEASELVRRGATKLCMALMQRLQASHGDRTSGGGGGGGGVGLVWHVLKSSQPSTPPMQRQTDAVTLLLQNWSAVQSESRMQVTAPGAPAGRKRQAHTIQHQRHRSVDSIEEHTSSSCGP
jgi:uncharacterized protein (DUF2126 family)